jgi:peptidoglycan hydrolase-like protein with peptidoglycan-binding domain
MNRLHKNQYGFAQHVLIPALVVLAIAAIGTYVLQKSKAATPANVSGMFGYNCNYMPAPTLYLGNTGVCVKVLQKGLDNYNDVASYFAHKSVAPHLTVDGVFGANTATALRYYQARHNLSGDGVAGQNTWAVFTRSCLTYGGGSSCFVSGVYN